MVKNYKNVLFIFRRDLRLDDNIGLLQALKCAERVIPCFILDPMQVGDKNSYRSENAVQFMIESLHDLAGSLKKKKAKLYVFDGDPKTVITKIYNVVKFDAVFINRDYTPYSKKRDKALAAWCKKHSVDFIAASDLLLHEPKDVLKSNKQPYTIFTPFYKKARLLLVRAPEKNLFKNYYTKSITGSSETLLGGRVKHQNNKLAVHGGRASCLKILKHLDDHKDYAKQRDIPSHATTLLSAHLKFGTCSVREIFHAIKQQLGSGHQLLRQLYWRDFFTHIAYNFPYVFGHAYHKKYDKLWWENDRKKFTAWCEGETGFPIVDAGMRELNTTGFMHNRVRMIVASFLTKDLHIDWQWGEKYFAQKLVDYDPSVNNGNWQWSASTGCDAQPYFRIFNPWLQQKKFDPHAEYIKRWVPELKQLTPKDIHAWYKQTITGAENYPKPIVDHAQESAKAKLLYKKVAKK